MFDAFIERNARIARSNQVLIALRLLFATVSLAVLLMSERDILATPQGETPFYFRPPGFLTIIVLVLTIHAPPTTGMLLSIIIYVISLLCIVKSMQTQELSLRPWFANLNRPPTGALLIAPVCLFGFLLCPYLDLTFHRARQATAPRAGAIAFALGFAGPFLLMIVFTLWYARLLAPLAAGQ